MYRIPIIFPIVLMIYIHIPKNVVNSSKCLLKI